MTIEKDMRLILRNCVRAFQSAALILAAWPALPALAQERPRGEIAVYLGEGHMGGKEGTYGKGAELGASVEIQPLSRIGLMVDVNQLNHSGSIAGANGTPDHWDIEGTAIYTSGSLVYHFLDTRFQPYVFGGAGALRTSREIRITGDFKEFAGPLCLLGCSPNIQPTRFEQVKVKETNPALHAGAGIRVPLGWSFSFRPEVRLVWAGNVHLAHAVFGLSYGW